MKRIIFWLLGISIIFSTLDCHESPSQAQQQNLLVLDSLQKTTSGNFILTGITEKVLSAFSSENSMTGSSSSRLDTIANRISTLQSFDTSRAKWVMENDSLLLQWTSRHGHDTTCTINIFFNTPKKNIESMQIRIASSYLSGYPHGSLGGEQGSGTDILLFTNLPYSWVNGSFTVDISSATLRQSLSKITHNAYIDGGNHFNSYSYSQSLLTTENVFDDSGILHLTLN